MMLNCKNIFATLVLSAMLPLVVSAQDLSFSDQAGDRWSVTFTGKRVSIIAPTGEYEGRMQVVIDGKACGEVTFHKGASHKAQQVVFTSKKLRKGKHTLELINRQGIIAVDALKID